MFVGGGLWLTVVASLGERVDRSRRWMETDCNITRKVQGLVVPVLFYSLRSFIFGSHRYMTRVGWEGVEASLCWSFLLTSVLVFVGWYHRLVMFIRWLFDGHQIIYLAHIYIRSYASFDIVVLMSFEVTLIKWSGTHKHFSLKLRCLKNLLFILGRHVRAPLRWLSCEKQGAAKQYRRELRV